MIEPDAPVVPLAASGHRAPSLTRNTLYSGLATGSNILLTGLVIVAARVMGESTFGVFSFALAIATVFEMVTDLGFNTLIARNVPRDRSVARTYLANVLAWKLVLATAAMLLFVLSVRLLTDAPQTRLVCYVLGAAIVLRSFKATCYAFFQAFERFDLVLLTTYLERGSVLVAGVVVLLVTRSVTAFALSFALVRVPDLAIALWLLHRKVVPLGARVNPAIVGSLQRAALPFAAYTLTTVTYSYVGTVVLSAMASAAQVGFYSAGYKVYEGFTMFPYLLSVVLLPRLSKLFPTDRALHTALSVRMLRYIAMAGIPLAAGVGMLAPLVIQVLYGDAYAPAVPLLRVLLAAAVFMFANFTLNTFLISADRETTVLKVAMVGLAVMLAANVGLIRVLGGLGAALAVIVSECAVFTMLLLSARRSLAGELSPALAWRPLAAGGAGGAAAWLVWEAGALVAAPIFALAYLGALALLGAVHAEDRAMLARFTRRRGGTPGVTPPEEPRA